MASKSIVSYWDGDSWEDFSVGGVSRLYDLSIVDTLGAPRRAVATIINNSSNPQSNSASSSKGPFTGVIGDFTPLKIRDQDTGELYFYGAVTGVEEEFSVSDGMHLVIEAYDYLFELKEQNTSGQNSLRQIANDRALIATLNEDLDSSETAIDVTNTDELFIGMRITFASNDEEMIITEINDSSNTINVVRGVNGEFDTHSNGAAMFEAATPVYQFVPRLGQINTETKEYRKPYGSRGGLVKSLVSRYSAHLRHTGPSVQVNEAIDASETELTVIDSTGMFVGQILKVDNEEMLVTAVTDKTTITVEREYRGTTAATHSDKAILQAVDDRWTESTANYTKNGTLKLASQSEKSVLNHIRTVSASEPHAALSAEQTEYGHDYYVSPNITSTGNVTPDSFLDYFKKGTRPTSEALGPTAFGLNIHYPSPDTITSGSFVTTGRQIPMRQSNIDRPKGEIYSDVTVQFNATSRGEKGDAVTTKNTEIFELLEVTDTNFGGDATGFIYKGRNISGGILTIGGSDLSYADSAEEFRKVMTQINMGSNFAAGATSLTVDSTADMYVGQVLFIGFPGEQVLITAINSSTNLTVQRGHNGTTDAERDDDAFISTIVGRIQYLSSGANNVSSSDSAYMLVSHLDPALDDSTVIWGTASAAPTVNAFFGNDSGFSFDLVAGGRPRIKLGVRKTKKMSVSGSVDPDTIREQIVSELIRLQNPPLRADVQSLYPPHFYIDNVPSAVSGSGTAEITVGNTLLTGTLNEGLDLSETGIDVTDSTGMYVGQTLKIDSEEFVITAVNSKTLITANRAQNSTSAAEHTSGASIFDANVDLTKYGFRTGMTINELDSNGLPTSTYGYATWVSSTKVKVTWATGSVDTNSTLRYYIPVRAGDNVRLRTDIQNVDTTFTVTGTEFIEANGGTSTRYNLVEKSALMPSGYVSSGIASVTEAVASDDALPDEPEFAANPTVRTTCTFSSTSASQVNWGAGNVYVGNEVFAIEGGNSSYLSALNSDGRIYYVYYIKGENIFRVIDDGDYAALVQERNDSDFKIIAEINYDLPYAVWRLVGIQGGFAQSSSPTSIPNAPRYYGDDGGAILPSYSFSSDLDTGMYRSATGPTLNFAVAGNNRAQLSGSGLQLTFTSSGSAGTVLHADNTSALIYKFTSSERYKKNIVDAALDSTKLYDLRPVEYENNENTNDEGKPGFGLIAEEVHELFPELVIYDEEGRPDSLSYDRLSVVLVMEIKKLKEEIEKLKENN